MKNSGLFLSFLICFMCNSIFAQIEIKTAPLMWVAKAGSIGVEYGIKPNLGIEAEYQRMQNGRTIQSSTLSIVSKGGFGAVKYYFTKNEETPLSKLYVGGYGTYLYGQSTTNNIKSRDITMYSFGATGGYKGLLVRNHLLLEGGLNFGKRFAYENGELAVAATPVGKFFNNWDVSLRLLVGYRF
jgi:hypothetical protein